MIKSKKKKILAASVGLIGLAAVSIVIFSSLDKKAVAASTPSPNNQKMPQNQNQNVPGSTAGDLKTLTLYNIKVLLFVSKTEIPVGIIF